MEDDNSVVRRDAGEPGKAEVKTKDVKTNSVRAEGGSKKSDRGDVSTTKNSEPNAKDAVKCDITKRKSNANMVMKDVNKTKFRLDNSCIQNTKYNKIMASIDKIIQENIDLINAKVITNDPKREDVTINKVDGKNDENKKGKVKQVEVMENVLIKKEMAKKEDKAFFNITKNMTNTKSSTCTPHDVENTLNDEKNKSLVIKIPKHTSGGKVQEKPKLFPFNKKVLESTKRNFSTFQHSASQTPECSEKYRQTEDFLKNKNNYWPIKIQTVAKDVNKKKTPLIRKDSKSKYDFNTNKPAPASKDYLKKKPAKKVKASNKSSKTKLIPMTIDEHAKLYYEAWINNVTVSTQEQLLEGIILKKSSDSVKKGMTENYTDKKFTGIIKVKCGKNLM